MKSMTMVIPTRASLLALLSIISLSTAHSPVWPTITYSESIHSLHHDILPRDLLLASLPKHRRSSIQQNHLKKRSSDNTHIIIKDDIIRLHLSAFNKTFYLHLEPNYDLIHPGLNLSGHEDIVEGSSLDKVEIKAFKGVVVQDEDHSRQKWQRSMTTSRTGNRNTVEHMLHEEGVLGWARMMIEHDDRRSIVLRGAFTVNDDTYHVTSRQHYHVQKRSDDHIPTSPSSSPVVPDLIIYRDSDLYHKRQIKRQNSAYNSTCGAEKIHNNSQIEHGYYYPPDLTSPLMATGTGSGGASAFSMSLFQKRQDPVTIKVAGPSPVPSGCPRERKVTYMGVAADCTYVRTYGGLNNARKQILADFNTASGIYESTFNVALGIKSMQIESMDCPQSPVSGKLWNQECSTDYTISDRLSDFSYWRGQDGRSNDGLGLWHLLTKCNSGSILGIAWTKALCQTSAVKQGSGAQTQYSSGVGVSSISPNEWMVVAHEIGHGFGANHDCTASNCVSSESITKTACCPLSQTTCSANDKYIMNPHNQVTTNVFSPCSINAICSTIASQGKCLHDPSAMATQPEESSVCGNGVREQGEECDCGTPEECANDPCCDGTTCKFKGSAVCDDLNDDCCHNCQLAPIGQVCRSATSNCDIPETCTGVSAACPDDVHVPDLTACQILSEPGNNLSAVGTGQCASGMCTSRDYQCVQQQREGINRQCGRSTSSCDLICNGPEEHSGNCMKIPGAYFLDGTPCGSSGTCSLGNCVYSGRSGGDNGNNHLGIIIPVVIVGALLTAGGIFLWFYCARKRRTKAKVSAKGGSYNSKDAGVMMDVPKWMLSGDRLSSHALPNTTPHAAMSRGASFTFQNHVHGSQGSAVQMPDLPATTHLQQSSWERVDHSQFAPPYQAQGLDGQQKQFYQYYPPSQYQQYSQHQYDQPQQQHNSSNGYM